MQIKGKLVLEDGSEFTGISFGAEKSRSGEVVFNTGMTGYPESLTDPSYRGQMLVLTYPLQGNYGVPEDNKADGICGFESDMIHVSGLIVSEYTDDFSHWSAKRSLSAWLKQNGVPALEGIDTRELTKKLREKGVMLGKIVIGGDVAIEDPNRENLVAQVSCSEPQRYGRGDQSIALIDCGAKNNIIRCLVKRGVEVVRVPWDYDISTIDFDGLMISNGPGDPKMLSKTIENIRLAIKKDRPIFGICLGNQLLALALGADTYKLRYGHRGQNQPCIDKVTGRCYITSQNHGFAVDMKRLPDGFEEWFVNANDGTNEGIRHKTRPISSVQFHPESFPGPTDTEYLFDEFISRVRADGRRRK